MIKAGTIIQGPLDQAYEVTTDLHSHMESRSSHFRPIGNAPSPADGSLMPHWLYNYLQKHFIAEAHDRG